MLVICAYNIYVYVPSYAHALWLYIYVQIYIYIYAFNKTYKIIQIEFKRQFLNFNNKFKVNLIMRIITWIPPELRLD